MKKSRIIRKQIIKKLKAISWREISEGSLRLEYFYLRKLFFGVFEKEAKVKESKRTIEEKEKLILSQGLLIMERIYFDPDGVNVFEKNMHDPIKNIIKTDDFLEFIAVLLHK